VVLEGQRDSQRERIDRIARKWIGYHPDTLTWISFGLAVGAMLMLLSARRFTTAAPAAEPLWMLMFLAGLLIFLNGVFDVLDGAVARLRGTASKRGDFLDHVVDRYADVVLILGFTFSPYGNLVLGLFAMTGVLLTSYMGTQAQAVGGKRKYAGWLSRADRILVMTLVAGAQPVLLWLMAEAPLIPAGWLGVAWMPQLHLFGLMLLCFAIVGNAAAVARARATWTELSMTPPEAPKPLSPVEELDRMIAGLEESNSHLEARIRELESKLFTQTWATEELEKLEQTRRMLVESKDSLKQKREQMVSADPAARASEGQASGSSGLAGDDAGRPSG
jgi:archaetidylinositol phosphate synthase